MHRPHRPFSRRESELAASRATWRVQNALRLAESLQNDTDRVERLKFSECKACYYISRGQGRIGGAAVTSTSCRLCAGEMVFSSTVTEELCSPCAKKESLCRHCGGDLEMRLKRRKWPAAYSE